MTITKCGMDEVIRNALKSNKLFRDAWISANAKGGTISELEGLYHKFVDPKYKVNSTSGGGSYSPRGSGGGGIGLGAGLAAAGLAGYGIYKYKKYRDRQKRLQAIKNGKRNTVPNMKV